MVGHEGEARSGRAFAWWLISSFGVFVATGLTITVVFEVSGDICDQFHESPNTPLGRSIVAVGAVAMAVVGSLLRPRRWLVLTACAISLHLMVYVDWLTPSGTCGWP